MFPHSYREKALQDAASVGRYVESLVQSVGMVRFHQNTTTLTKKKNHRHNSQLTIKTVKKQNNIAGIPFTFFSVLLAVE